MPTTATKGSSPQYTPISKARGIFNRIFDYPSPLVLTIQAALILFLTSWISWILLVITIILALWYFTLRFIEVVNDPEGKETLPVPETVLITGASAGIGQALAIRYAQMGTKTIYITARAVKNLDETVQKVKASGCNNVFPLALDVTDKDAMDSKLKELDQTTPIDLIIANAGISPEQQKGKPQEEIIRSTYNTNITGVLNTIFPLYDTFVSRRSGHFVLISSIASFGSIAHPAYSSSKALVTVLGQGLRRDLAPHNVKVTVVCPGYILTNMTSERDSQRRATTQGFVAKVKDFLGLGGLPFIRPVEDAAEAITKGIQYNLDVIIFPFRLGLFAWVLRYMPFTLQDKLGATMANLAYRGTGTVSTDPTSGQQKVD